MYLLVLFSVACLSGGVLSSSIITPCKISDAACVEKSVITATPKIFAGIPELGVEPSDPMFIELIEGNLSIIKYKFFNTTIVGYKQCGVANVKINKDLTNLKYELHCEKMTFNGKYEVDGRLVILPVEGKGDFVLTTGKYVVAVDADMKKVQGHDGKTHLNIKSFKLKAKPLSAIKFDFKNLFNGQKDLSDAVHKFANENWSEVAELVQDPVWNASTKKIIGNVNKFLKAVPVEDIFII